MRRTLTPTKVFSVHEGRALPDLFVVLCGLLMLCLHGMFFYCKLFSKRFCSYVPRTVSNEISCNTHQVDDVCPDVLAAWKPRQRRQTKVTARRDDVILAYGNLLSVTKDVNLKKVHEQEKWWFRKVEWERGLALWDEREDNSLWFRSWVRGE